MDDWNTSAPSRLTVNDPAHNNQRPVIQTLTRPAPSWMTNHTPYQPPVRVASVKVVYEAERVILA